MLLGRIIFLLIFVSGSTLAFSDDIAGITDQKITDIRVSPLDTDTFAIKTTAPPASTPPATVVCEGLWVVFKKENFGSPTAYDRAYSLALSAISMNQRIYVIIDTANDCTSAKSIAFLN